MKKYNRRLDHRLGITQTIGMLAYIGSLIFPSNMTAQQFVDVVIDPFGLMGYVNLSSVMPVDFDGDYDIFGGAIYYQNIGTSEIPKLASPQKYLFNLDILKKEGGYPEIGDLDGDIDLVTMTYWTRVNKPIWSDSL